MSELTKALAELHGNLPTIRKTSRGQVGGRETKYANLKTVTTALAPLMAKLGLDWHTSLRIDPQGQFVVHWTLTHLPSGEADAGDWPITSTDPQKRGSEITYARRYALVTVTGVIPEGDDDDGHAASTPKRTPTRTTTAEHERAYTENYRGPVDGAERLTAPDPADPWADSVGEAEHRPGTIDGRQRTRIMQLFGKTPRDERLAMLSQWAGREIDSANDLSRHEAGLAIAELEARR